MHTLCGGSKIRTHIFQIGDHIGGDENCVEEIYRKPGGKDRRAVAKFEEGYCLELSVGNVRSESVS